jgi:RimJ/RimL family protein N-acetyltransferase
MNLPIRVDEELQLTEVRESDREYYVEYLNAREIYQNTLLIPSPYTLEHADAWIALNRAWQKDDPRLTHFAVRDTSGRLLGGADFQDLRIGHAHKAEIGYWTAKPFWGRGIMTRVVGKLCEIGFQEFGLQRITAMIFAGNTGSRRVLEKNGFVAEGRLRNYYRKNGQLLDAEAFAKFP